MMESLRLGATSYPSRSRQKRATVVGRSDFIVTVAIRASDIRSDLGLLELEAIAERVECVEPPNARQFAVRASDAGAFCFKRRGKGVEVSDQECRVCLLGWGERLLDSEVEDGATGGEPTTTTHGECRWLRNLIHPQGGAVVLASSRLAADRNRDLDVVEARDHSPNLTGGQFGWERAGEDVVGVPQGVDDLIRSGDVEARVVPLALVRA